MAKHVLDVYKRQVLVSMVSLGCSTERRTMGCAARWKTISGRWVAMVSHRASKSRMSPRTSLMRSLSPDSTKLLGCVGGSGRL